jgi:hypothetical protein
MAPEAHTAVECINEALRLLAKATGAVGDDERLHLLDQAAAWLEIAKYRIGQKSDRPQGSP